MKFKQPDLKLDYNDPYINDLTRHIYFLDIETSLCDARVFRPGQQFVAADQLLNSTRILTVAYGSVYDLEHKGEKGVKVLSNRRSSTFKKDPLDDTELLEKLWPVLDDATAIGAHHAAFDRGWIEGRFVEQGWMRPSKFYTFCTYRNLQPFQMTSKKLDELSKRLLGTRKIKTDMDLWMRCSDGDVEAFKEMETYNIGDIHDTMFRLWKRTAYYNPNKSIDFTNYKSDDIVCRVDGQPLDECDELYFNRTNGKQYFMYHNPRANLYYQDRYNTDSKKAGLGFIKPLLSNGE